MEIYKGVKFEVVFINRSYLPDDPRLEELKYWCGEFHHRNFAPSYAEFSQGNLSFRIQREEEPFIITGSRVGWKDRLSDDAFVTVHACDFDLNVVYASGMRDPSSEAMLHGAIYRRRKDVEAVFHGHCPEILSSSQKLNLRETKEQQPYGSSELVESVLDVLDNESFIIMKRHGFISLGKTMKEAGERAVEMHCRCAV
jgi:ribulose-5-phosphate 4-epimerase/fuculose-1-phosphate aldolase